MDLNQDKLKTAKVLGFTNLAKSADEFDQPRGFDVVIDCTGVTEAIKDGLKHVMPSGTFLQFGVANKDAKVEIEPFWVYNKEITIDELMQFIKAPDFPGGGIIFGMEGVKSAMHTGRGKVVLRGKVSIETKSNGREQIIITEVPYQVSRDVLTERIGQLVNDKALYGIKHVNN